MFILIPSGKVFNWLCNRRSTTEEGKGKDLNGTVSNDDCDRAFSFLIRHDHFECLGFGKLSVSIISPFGVNNYHNVIVLNIYTGFPMSFIS